jgi:protein gp37
MKVIKPRIKDWPPKNLIFMVTAGTVQTVKEKVSILKEIPAAVKGVIAEPLLEDIAHELEPFMSDIDWIIFGGENGARDKVRKTRYAYANNLLESGLKYNKKVFFKGWGRFIPPGQEPGKINGVAYREFPDM